MDLSNQQLDAAKGGAAVRFTAGDTEFVIVRADLFEQVTHPPYDDEDWTEDEMRSLAARTFEDADTAGPIESGHEAD